MKKSLLLFFAVLMITALTACGGQTASESNSSGSASEIAVESVSEEALSENPTVVEASSEDSASSSLTFDASYTDDAGRVYTTYTAKELVEKIVAMEEAGADLFNNVNELSPDGYIQVPVHFTYAGGGSRTDNHDTEVYLLIKDYRELNNEPGFRMECRMIKNTSDAGIDALTAAPVVYFYDNDAPENKAYAGSALQEKLTDLITAPEDPYQPYLLRCKVSELVSTNTTIKGEAAAHGYTCILYITDIVPIE